MQSWRRLLFAVLMLWLASALCGCRSHHMRPVQNPQPIGPFPDNAVVVFVYPETPTKSTQAVILDGQGNFLGTALPGSHFGVLVPPGEQVFICWAEDTTPLRADLAAGRVYYVLVRPHANSPGSVAELLAIKPDTPAWPMVPQWLRDTRQYAPDIPGGRASMQQRQAEVNAAVVRGQQVLGLYNSTQLAERTLAPAHGVAATVQPGGVMPPPASAAAGAGEAPTASQPPAGAPEGGAPEKPTEKKAPKFDEMTSVGKDDKSGAELRVIAKGTLTSEKGTSVSFQAKPENFGDKFVGYTYDAQGIDQLSEGDSLLLFVVGLAYRKVAVQAAGSEEVFEDQAGNLALAPEDWGGGHLNGAWVEIQIDSIKRTDSGLRVRLSNRVLSTIGSIHKELELVRGDDGYTLKPLLRTKAAARKVPEISPDRAKRKAGVFALYDEAFASSGEMGCSTDAEVTAVENDEAQMQGKLASRGGKPWVWCHGAKHKWLGTLKYKRHTFRSSKDTPLQFMIDRNKGYVYVDGKGSVTLPTGRMVQLP